MLALTPDELLSTTRAVRKRLDFDRSVPRELIEECIALALQAPSASNSQPWVFLVVTDEQRKADIADWYRKSYNAYATARAEEAVDPAVARMAASSRYLADRLHEVPAFVIPCVHGRLERRAPDGLAAGYGSIVQAGWSFCLAARARGLGTCWTTLHLSYEREVAGILGVPFEDVTQTSLITVGYTLGTDFKPAPRGALDDVVRWDTW
jgi:nitroreductase